MTDLAEIKEALTEMEFQVLSDLKRSGGKEWDRFRARRNSYMRHPQFMSEIDATKKALEPVMGKLIQFRNQEPIFQDSFDPPKKFPRLYFSEKIKLWACSSMLVITSSYQVFAQQRAYGGRLEGWLQALIAEAVLLMVAITPTTGKIGTTAKYTILAFLVTHLAFTLNVSAEKENQRVITQQIAEQSVSANVKDGGAISSDQLKKQLVEKIANIPAEHSSNLVQLIPQGLQALERVGKTPENQPKTFFSQLSEISVLGNTSRVLIINLLAQLFFAHALCWLLAGYFARKEI